MNATFVTLLNQKARGDNRIQNLQKNETVLLQKQERNNQLR